MKLGTILTVFGPLLVSATSAQAELTLASPVVALNRHFTVMRHPQLYRDTPSVINLTIFAHGNGSLAWYSHFQNGLSYASQSQLPDPAAPSCALAGYVSVSMPLDWRDGSDGGAQMTSLGAFHLDFEGPQISSRWHRGLARFVATFGTIEAKRDSDARYDSAFLDLIQSMHCYSQSPLTLGQLETALGVSVWSTSLAGLIPVRVREPVSGFFSQLPLPRY